MSPKFLAALVLGVVLIIFTAQNAGVVEIRFLTWTLEMSRAIVLFLVFASGVSIGWLIASVSRIGSRG